MPSNWVKKGEGCLGCEHKGQSERSTNLQPGWAESRSVLGTLLQKVAGLLT